jgi:hypothetical protein
MASAVESLASISARLTQVQDRDERRLGGKGGRNGGFNPGYILFLIGVFVIVVAAAMESGSSGQTPNRWQAAYDCNAMPTTGLVPCK